MRRTALHPLVLLAACALLLAACGGGGGGGPTDPPPPQAGIVFTPDAAGANSVGLAAGAGSSASTLVLEVRATGVQDLYGLSFDLRYPSTLLRFAGVTEGPFLGAGGVATSLQLTESPAGNLIVGLTRLGNAPGASGSGVLLTLRFDAVAAGTGPFTLQGPLAVDSTGTAMPGLTWAAGSVQVTR